MTDYCEDQVAGSVAGLTAEDATVFEEIVTRLKEATNTKTDGELSLALGLKISAVSTARGRRVIPPAWVLNVSKSSNVSADWLAFGSDFYELTKQKSKPELADDYVKVPRVATELAAGAGSFLDSIEVVEELAFRREWLARKGNPKDLVVMTIYGDSMEPTLHEKDNALINLSQTKPHTGQIYAVGHDEALYIKRLVCEPGRLIMRSDNSRYTDIVLDFNNQAIMDKLKIIGRAVWWCHDERN